MDLLGHSSPAVLKRYQAVVDDLKQQAAEQFDRLFSAARE